MLDDEGLLCPVGGIGDSEAVSFSPFWREGVRERHVLRWRRSSARVMAAVLRLIAAGAGAKAGVVGRLQ